MLPTGSTEGIFQKSTLTLSIHTCVRTHPRLDRCGGRSCWPQERLWFHTLWSRSSKPEFHNLVSEKISRDLSPRHVNLCVLCRDTSTSHSCYCMLRSCFLRCSVWTQTKWWVLQDVNRGWDTRSFPFSSFASYSVFHPPKTRLIKWMVHFHGDSFHLGFSFQVRQPLWKIVFSEGKTIPGLSLECCCSRRDGCWDCYQNPPASCYPCVGC